MRSEREKIIGGFNPRTRRQAKQETQAFLSECEFNGMPETTVGTIADVLTLGIARAVRKYSRRKSVEHFLEGFFSNPHTTGTIEF